MRTRTHARKATDHYFELVTAFPLKPLRTDAQYAEAQRVLAPLVVRPEGTLETGERDYMEALTLMVEAFDRDHMRLIPTTTPLGALRYVMKQSGLKVKDLGRIVGSQPAASMILRGDREMSKKQIKALAAYFKVAPSYFL